jgi:hypothetical protein
MKNFLFGTLILFSITLFSETNTSTNTNDTSNKKPNPPKDRNMFRLRIPRGLTINSEGLNKGYIMFAVPNSASVYLINRKGELVHEWKGNSAVMGAYLADNGSIVQNVNDPDFPVFAGGGETGRIQKISWNSKMLWDFEYANEKFHAHHDFSLKPNSNILTIAWEAKTML